MRSVGRTASGSGTMNAPLTRTRFRYDIGHTGGAGGEKDLGPGCWHMSTADSPLCLIHQNCWFCQKGIERGRRISHDHIPHPSVDWTVDKFVDEARALKNRQGS